jgi:hypothetical protein
MGDKGSSKPEKKGKGVKPRLDTGMTLVKVPGLGASGWSDRRIRALHQGGLDRMLRGEPGECMVVKELIEWKRSNRKEYLQIEEGLCYLAENPDVRQTGGVKYVTRDIIEVKAGHLRLYCFMDPHTSAKLKIAPYQPTVEEQGQEPDEDKMTTQFVIAAVTQSVNTGNKDDVQRAAIKQAGILFRDWKESATDERVPRLRFKTR